MTSYDIKSSFGYFPLFAGFSKSALNPAQTGSTTKTSPVVAAAAGSYAISAETLTGGYLSYDPSGGAANATLPSASDVLAIIGNSPYTSFRFIIENTADASETITLTDGGDSKNNLVGTMTIAQDRAREFVIYVKDNDELTITTTGTYNPT